MARRKSAASENYLDRVPRRNVDFEEDGDGRLVLLRPKFMSGPLARWLQPRLPRRFFRVKLDDVGAAVWQSIDGARNVGDIAEILFEKFGERVEPRYERCARFVRSLENGAMVSMTMPGAGAEG
ncbi:MAG: PqqD family protein [Deltaproteobacteria bacterium]|nr:PqqD family protein [Deltaproteobacteria bacterium]